MEILRNALFVLVVAFPFLAQAVPYGFPLFTPVLLLLFVVGFLTSSFRFGLEGISLGLSPFFFVICALALTYVYGLILSPGPDPIFIIREMANGAAALVVYLVATNARWTSAEAEKIVKATCLLLVIFGLVAGLLGMYKFYLLLHGETLDWVGAASDSYPWGTSLVADYNFYSLTLLVAVLSTLVLATRCGFVGHIALGAILVILLVAGVLAGSRRFWVAAPVLVLGQLVWLYLRSEESRAAIGRFLRRFTFAFALLIIVLLPFAPQDILQYVETGWNFNERLASLWDSSAALGKRFPLWNLALQSLSGDTPWYGQGFTYLKLFSCRLLDCIGVEYPHMPLLSAYLYGGVVAFSFGLAFYWIVFAAGAGLFFRKQLSGGLALPLLATLLFASISGNGPFSIRCFLTLGAFCIVISHSSSRKSPGSIYPIVIRYA